MYLISASFYLQRMLSFYRKANELEELKKVVFSVNTVKEKEHDIEKAKAKIQDLHR